MSNIAICRKHIGHLFKSSNGDIGLQVFVGALFGQLVVNLAAAEEQSSDMRRAVSGRSAVCNDALELRAVSHLVYV